MRLSHRDQLIALGVVIALLAVAIVFLLIMPQRRTMSRLDEEIGAARVEIASAQSLVARRQEAKRSAAVTEAELLRLANAIPESPEVPSLIIELQDTANDAGLEFVKIAPAADLEQREGYQAAKIGLTVTGQWADIVHFLQRIQKLNRELRVVDCIVAENTTQIAANPAIASTAGEDDTAVQAEDQEEPKLELQADLTIEVYTIAAGASASAVPGAVVTPASD